MYVCDSLASSAFKLRPKRRDLQIYIHAFDFTCTSEIKVHRFYIDAHMDSLLSIYD